MAVHRSFDGRKQFGSFGLEFALATGVLFLLGCGSGTRALSSSSGNAPATSPVSPAPQVLSIETSSTTIAVGGMMAVSANVDGKATASVEWSADGVSGGTASSGFIAPDGMYTAPLLPVISVKISATLKSDSRVKSSVTINVVSMEPRPGMISFSFSLPESARTSAGVYDSKGNMVKTLWSNVPYSTGSHIETWNGTNDLGDTISDGSYTIKLLRNNVKYEWGLVGNTSRTPTALRSWDMQSNFPTDMAFSSDVAYTANGYSEGRPNTSSFGLADPQTPENVMTLGQDILFAHVAADDTRVYFANVGNGWGGSTAFIMAYDRAAKRQYVFPAGGKPARKGPPLSGVLDLDKSGKSGSARVHLPTGIAVQRYGNLLAVAHGSYYKDGASVLSPSEDRIILFDKQTGAVVGGIQISDPQRMAFSRDGDLWVISGTHVVRISGVGQSNVVSQSIEDLSRPLAIAVGPTGIVAVVDGGVSQQVKLFTLQGNLISTYGQAGGYADCNPSVRFDRLYLDPSPGTGAGNNQAPATWITFQSDGSFWIGDLGNGRALHISSSGAYLEQVAFIRFLYQVAADHNDPTRIFADWLEYKVDYPSSAGAGGKGDLFSWNLEKNWSVCSGTGLRPFTRVITMSNRKTYGQVGTLTSPSNAELVELQTEGPLRHTGQFLFSGYFPEFLDNKGNVSYWAGLSKGSNLIFTALQRDFIGFDATDTPRWGSARPVASVSTVRTANDAVNDPFGFGGWGMRMYPEATNSGYFVTYNTTNTTIAGRDFHLGGVMQGSNDWAWKTSRGALIKTPDGKGSFPDYSSYGGHNGIAALVEGNNIIQGYDGQYGSFSNQWMHWWEDGLMIGQFGNPPSFSADGGMIAGTAGNIASMVSVSVGKDIYLYHSDEGLHPGIHRWRFSGLDTIHELKGTTTLGSDVILENLF